MVSSYIILDGYWLYVVYSKFQNPFFPMFNDIFHSPYAGFENVYIYDFQNIKANSFWHFIFYPFIHDRNLHYGFWFQNFEPRIYIFFICLFIIAILFLFFKKLIKNFPTKNINYLYFLLIFCFLSYEINILIFGLYRYIVATNLLFGLILFFTFFTFIPKEKYVNILMLLAIIFTISSQKIEYLNKFFLFSDQKTVLHQTEIYDIEDNSFVFTQVYEPSKYIIRQKPNVTYIGFSNHNTSYQLKIFNEIPRDKKIYLFIDSFLKSDILLHNNFILSNCVKSKDTFRELCEVKNLQRNLQNQK